MASENNLPELAAKIIHISFIFGWISPLMLAYTVLFPNFKISYRSIYTIIGLTALFCIHITFNTMTVHEVVEGDIFKFLYLPLGSILFASGMIIEIILIWQRVMQINRLINIESPFKGTRFLIIYTISCTLAMLIIGISRAFPTLNVPALLWGIPISIGNTYFALIFTKDKGFLYITPARLSAIIIADKNSGISLYSKNYKKDFPAEDILSSLFNSLNYSLKKTVQSSTDMEHIGFGDKSVLIAHGKRVSVLMIVSEVNLVTKSISKYLARVFEQEFQDLIQLGENMPIHDSFLYKNFDIVVDNVRQYIPL